MTKYYSPITYIVAPEEDGIQLKTILQTRMGVSRKLLSRLKLTEEGIKLNGQRVYISVLVRSGDVVEIRMEVETSDDILPQPIPFEILYEDDHLLVINKSAGIIVHPTHGHYTNTLANGVVHYWQSKGLAYRFRAVHRLDQETSGVIAIAKNAYVGQHISQQMLQGTVDKKYVAVVHGVPEASEGSIDGPIDRDPQEPHRRIVTPTGYPSLTKYKLLESFGDTASRIQLKLETGRTHQIRVHMTSIGCPLIGDQFYQHVAYRSEQGYAKEEPAADQADTASDKETLERIRALDQSIGRQALHASELSLFHPMLQQQMTFEAPLPPDMMSLCKKLREIKPNGGIL